MDTLPHPVHAVGTPDGTEAIGSLPTLSRNYISKSS